MSVAFRLGFIVTSAAVAMCAQEIRIYSDLERIDPFGNPVVADRDMSPREILSPAIARNGHLTVHVVVTAPKGTTYFLYAATNPPDILDFKIYREHFTPCAGGFCPDWVTEQRVPSFGVIPELVRDTVRPAMNNQTTRCYLLDIHARADTPPRRVRVEALLKTGIWDVAPMEVRIVAPTVPDYNPPDNRPPTVYAEDVAPLDSPASETARIQMFRYAAGLPAELPERMVRIRDFIQRNAAEDMILARSLEPQGFAPRPGQRSVGFPELNQLAWWPFAWPEVGAEWYLRVRDFLYRF